MIRVALEEMDLDVFGIFISNLPAEAQRDLREAYEKEFAGLPLPWEEGYDPGSMDNTNPYLKYLKKFLDLEKLMGNKDKFLIACVVISVISAIGFFKFGLNFLFAFLPLFFFKGWKKK